jgi:hypothetical protein
MKTLIDAIRKVKLANGNHINAIEKKQNMLTALTAQLDLLYGNPLRFENKINSLETKLATMRGR